MQLKYNRIFEIQQMYKRKALLFAIDTNKILDLIQERVNRYLLTKCFKNIMSGFTATHNPFNQNLNYEKILRFSKTKVRLFFI